MKKVFKNKSLSFQTILLITFLFFAVFAFQTRAKAAQAQQQWIIVDEQQSEDDFVDLEENQNTQMIGTIVEDFSSPPTREEPKVKEFKTITQATYSSAVNYTQNVENVPMPKTADNDSQISIVVMILISLSVTMFVFSRGIMHGKK